MEDFAGTSQESCDAACRRIVDSYLSAEKLLRIMGRIMTNKLVGLLIIRIGKQFPQNPILIIKAPLVVFGVSG